MGITKAHYRTFFLALAVGSWLFLGFLLPICSIHLVLSGRSKYHFSNFLSHGFAHVLLTICFTPFRTVEDFRDWTNWLFYRGGIGVKGGESWEAWWDEELVHLLL